MVNHLILSDTKLFYAKLASLLYSSLEIINPINKSIQEITSFDYAIPTKEQLYGNCGYKSLKIFWQYFAQLKLASGEIELSGEEKNIYQLFKEFKGDLTISAVERLIEFKENLEKSDYSQEFKDFFTSKIDKTLNEVRDNAEIKIAKNSDGHDDVDLTSHQKIKDLIENYFKSLEVQESHTASQSSSESSEAKVF